MLKNISFDISGITLDISIPENVSVDMPATELAPLVDTDNPNTFRTSNKIPLMKVIYDFPKPGWLKGDYGSMAMTLWLHRKSETYNHNILQREQLIKVVQQDLKEDYQEFNNKVLRNGRAAGKLSIDLIKETINYSGNTDEEIRDHKFNGTLWIEHFIGGLEHHRIYCTAISNKHYISIDFEDMNASNVFFDKMIEISTPYSNVIMNSAKLKLTQNDINQLSKGIVIENE